VELGSKHVAFTSSSFIITISQVLISLPCYQPMRYILIEEISTFVIMIIIIKAIIRIVTSVSLIKEDPNASFNCEHG
jgi:hypothetical protein